MQILYSAIFYYITKKFIDFKTFFSSIFYILLFSFIFDITILLGYIYKAFINKIS